MLVIGDSALRDTLHPLLGDVSLKLPISVSGVEIVKVFPGGLVGGPPFIKAVRGPSPWTRIMPTGGVDATEENVKGWIEAGASCLGMGSKLVRKGLVLSGNYDAISENVSNVLRWIQEARGEE